MTDFAAEPAADSSGAPQRRHVWRWVCGGVLGFGLIAVLVVACVLWIPRALYPPLSGEDLSKVPDGDLQTVKDARLALQNGARTSLLQGFTALLLLTGAGAGAAATLTATLRQVRATRDQIKETAKANQDQLALNERGQLTDRYTNAVDRLGSKELDVRLGGIFALGRIARDSRDDRAMIYAVLSAFVLGRSPWPPRLPGQYVERAPLRSLPELLRRAADVQAALTVLAHHRANPAPGQQPGHDASDPLDLSHADLRRANLTGAQLQGALLYHSRLQRATLLDADLQGAQLILADLEDAALAGAQLQGADLTRANLRDADLRDANLRGADLSEVELGGARANRRTLWPESWSRARANNAGVRFLEDEGTGGAHARTSAATRADGRLSDTAAR